MTDTPKGTPRWRRIPQDRAAAILSASLAEFDVKGLSGARMDDIATAARLSKGSIYRYFPDKHALFAATVQSTLEEALQWGGGGPPTDRQLFLRRVWALTRNPRFKAAYRLSLFDHPDSPSVQRIAGLLIEQALIQPYSHLLGQTERATSLPSDSPLTRARLAIATLLGTLIHDTPESMDASVAFLLRACELESQHPQADGF